MADPTNPNDVTRTPWVNPYVDQPPDVWAAGDIPIAPPATAATAGRTGHWEWHEEFDADGVLVKRCPIWQDDPITPPDRKQRGTARDLVTALKAEVDARDVTIATVRAFASPTVTQHRRFSVAGSAAQSRIVKLQGRIALRLLDAGDGIATETLQ